MFKVTNERCIAIRFEDEVLAVLICRVNRESVGRALTITSVYIFANDYGASTFKDKLSIA